jgi:hypothetical protein
VSASEYQTGRYHNGECWSTCLYRLGHKRIHVTMLGSTGVTVVSEPKEDARHIEPLARKGAPYPLDRMVRHFRKFGRELGITEGAKAELERAS